MKVGLFFGSFNPIHNGHLIIASYFVASTDLSQVWFVVSPQNPFKKNATLLSEHHRLHMIKSAIEGEKNLRASNVEFKLPKPSYTIDTLIYLKEKYPGHEFSVLLGSDGFQNLNKWKNYEIIVKNYPIYIFNRHGFAVKNTFGASVQILNAPLLDISSTLVRDLVKSGKSIRYFVPDIVKEEIESGGYYRAAL